MPSLFSNLLLAELPLIVQVKLQAITRVVTIHAHREFILQDEKTNYVYFPETALLSMVHVLPDASQTEILLVGGDGVLSAPSLKWATQVIVGRGLKTGTAVRVPQSELRFLAERNYPLQRLLAICTDHAEQEMMQTIACYRHHSVKQQLSRWLLAYDDRFPHAAIHTSHAELAQRLGVRREAVSTAAKYLQQVGAIRYHRSQIEWINHSILVQHTCACYEALLENRQEKARQLMPGFTLA